MGQQHNELRRGPWSNALANALADTRGGGLERYGETLTPTLNLWERPEHAFLRDEHRFAHVLSVAAVAAEFAFVGVRNPADSGLICVIEHADTVVASGGAGVITRATLLDSNAIDVDAVSGITTLDPRFRPNSGNYDLGVGGIVTISGTGAATQGQPFWAGSTTAVLGEVQLPFAVTLTPGSELRLYLQTVNIGMQGSVQGYFRQGFTELSG